MKSLLSNLEFYKKLWSDIYKNWVLYATFLPIVGVVSCIYAQSQIDQYQCFIKLAPEQNANDGSYKFVKLAALFGNKLSKKIPDEGIYPSVYPDLMKTIEFKKRLLAIQLVVDGNKSVSYYDYLVNYQKNPWWYNLFRTNKKNVVDTINTHALTLSQYYLMKTVGGNVKCDIDEITNVITITVKDQNPVVAAMVADSACMLLQKTINDYRSSKAYLDYVYYYKIQQQRRTKYEQALRAFAELSDANKDPFFEHTKSKLQQLEEEMNLQYQLYSDSYSQMLAAQSKIQEAKPAFTTLQSATVPLEKSEPSRTIIVIAVLLLSFVLISIYIFYKEGDLKRVLLGDRALGISKCSRICI